MYKILKYKIGPDLLFFCLLEQIRVDHKNNIYGSNFDDSIGCDVNYT